MIYRISWEMVHQGKMYLYSNVDPTFYSNTKQTIPNSGIPDEHWYLVSKETDSPWDQFCTLKKWSEEGKGFVRNVKLEKMVSEPQWEEVISISE